MSLDDFYYYYYWKVRSSSVRPMFRSSRCSSQNPYWGPPAQTHKKVREFYTTDWISSIKPIEGALEGVAALCRLGYRLVIVTARNEQVRDSSWEWTQRHFPGCFEEIICTGQFAVQQGLDGGRNNTIPKKVTKAEVCIRIGAKLLIDDSLENAVDCAEYVPPSEDSVAPPVLLFGDYQWHRRISSREDERDDMTYARRVELRNGDTSFLEEDIREGEKALARVNEKRQNCVQRMKDWKEVVRYVETKL